MGDVALNLKSVSPPLPSRNAPFKKIFDMNIKITIIGENLQK